jgi:hypothetical protein
MQVDRNTSLTNLNVAWKNKLQNGVASDYVLPSIFNLFPIKSISKADQNFFPPQLAAGLKPKPKPAPRLPLLFCWFSHHRTPKANAQTKAMRQVQRHNQPHDNPGEREFWYAR